jgi:biotin carboxyl carrier protein
MAASGRRAQARFRVEHEGQSLAVAISREGAGWQVTVGDAPALRLQADWTADGDLLLTPAHGTPRRFAIAAQADEIVVNHRGTRWRLRALPEVETLARVAAKQGAQGSEIVSEMPGAITTIHVAAGDTVAAGDVLVVMEAMKLIFPLVAPRAGTVVAVRCQAGDIVSRGQTLVQLEPLDAAPAGPAAS